MIISYSPKKPCKSIKERMKVFEPQVMYINPPKILYLNNSDDVM